MFILHENLVRGPFPEFADPGLQDALREEIDENLRSLRHRLFTGAGWLATVATGGALASLPFHGTYPSLVIGGSGLILLAAAVAWALLGVQARNTRRAYERLLEAPSEHSLGTGRIEHVSRWRISNSQTPDVSLVTWTDALRGRHRACVELLAARRFAPGEPAVYAADRRGGSALLLGPAQAA